MIDKLYKCVHCVITVLIKIQKISVIPESHLMPHLNSNNCHFSLQIITDMISLIIN